MTFLIWRDGPTERGCTYHKRAIHKLTGENLVVDVFVMPRLADARPIAVTIGRYRDGQPTRPKQQLGVKDPASQPGRLKHLSASFGELGIDAQTSAYLADEVDQFLVNQADELRRALVD